MLRCEKWEVLDDCALSQWCLPCGMDGDVPSIASSSSKSQARSGDHAMVKVHPKEDEEV